jgi:hypothetical protein
MSQPATIGSSIRIGKGKDLHVSSPFEAGGQVVDFLTASIRGTGEDQLPRPSLGLEHSPDDGDRRVGVALDDKDHVQRLVVLPNE